MTTFLLFIVSMFFSTMIRGWVLAVQWEWFLVPLGAPAVGVAQAIGISIVVAMLTHQPTKSKDDDKSAQEILWLALINSIVLSLFYLVLGFIILQFLGTSL